MDQSISPLTGLLCDTDRRAAEGLTFYHDPACGDFGVYDDSLQSLSPADKAKIGMILAQRSLRATGEKFIITHSKSTSLGMWTGVPAREILAQYPRDNASIIDEALLNMSLMITFPSDQIEITDRKQWRIYARDHQSQEYILRQLKDLNYIKDVGSRSGGTYMIRSVTIESEGWKRLQLLKKESINSDQVFVAMWFADEMQETFTTGIEPAITECGLRCRRIDQKEHNNKICDEIIAEIRRSRFLIADFSGNRGGVYYEAGFAHGLGIPVIWTVREDDLGRVHFDTRQYNHIVYKTPDELKIKLKNRILATQLQSSN